MSWRPLTIGWFGAQTRQRHFSGLSLGVPKQLLANVGAPVRPGERVQDLAARKASLQSHVPRAFSQNISVVV